MSQLVSAFDAYQQQVDTEYRTKLADEISSSKRVTQHTETQTDNYDESPPNSPAPHDESDDEESNGWFDASPVLADKEERQFEDLGIQCRLLDDAESPVPSDRNPSEPIKMSRSLIDNETQTDSQTMTAECSSQTPETMEVGVEQIIRHYPHLFADDNENPLERLSDINSIIAGLQDEITALRR